MREPNFLLKIIPHVDATPRICELVRYHLEDVTIKQAWTAPAELQLFRHVVADVARLPVLEIVSSLHFVADLTLGLGTVAHDYLGKIEYAPAAARASRANGSGRQASFRPSRRSAPRPAIRGQSIRHAAGAVVCRPRAVRCIRSDRGRREGSYQEGLPRLGCPPLPRARSDRAGQLRLEAANQHHDHGLAHDHGVRAVAGRLLHLDREPQLRDDPQEQGVRDQHPDRGAGAEGRRHRQHLGPRHRQVRRRSG